VKTAPPLFSTRLLQTGAVNTTRPKAAAIKIMGGEYNTELDLFSAVESGKSCNLCPDKAWKNAYMTYTSKWREYRGK